MKGAVIVSLASALILITGRQLLAPVHEVDGKATPRAEEPTQPKTKHKAESKSDEVSETSESKSTPRPSGKAKNLGGPSPQYPAEAAALHLSRAGIYLLRFDQSTGLVVRRPARPFWIKRPLPVSANGMKIPTVPRKSRRP